MKAVEAVEVGQLLSKNLRKIEAQKTEWSKEKLKGYA